MVQHNHNGHRSRLKARFLNEGLDNFEMHNILELLLFYACPRIDTNDIAHELLNKFGSISEVFDASLEDLKEVAKIGDHAAVLLKLIPDIARIYQQDKTNKDTPLDSHDKMGEFLIPKFVGRKNEVVYIVCLDSNCHIISCDLLFEGSVGDVNLNIRKIVKQAIKYNCQDIILAHNHPRGLALPSSEDIIATRSVIKCLAPLNITLLDHIVVSNQDYCSLANNGYIKNIYNEL